MKRHLPILIVLLVAVVAGVRATGSKRVPRDFLRYHRAGRIVATGQSENLYEKGFLREQGVYAKERSEDLRERGDAADPLPEHKFKYLPATAVMLSPIGTTHPRTGHVLWAAWNGMLIALMFVAVWQLASKDVRAWWILVPLLVFLRVGNSNINLGQLNPSAIVPATLGLIMLSRKRDVAAGLLIAFATVVKFMPGVLLVWLAWKRRWKALGTAVAGIAAIGWGVPALVLGPSAATALTRQYFDVRLPDYTNAAMNDLPGHSIKSFVYRVFGETKFLTGRGADHVELDVSIVHLPAPVLQWGTLIVSVAVLAFVLWKVGPRLRTADDEGAALEIGLILAALLLISPEARAAHFLYAAPLGLAVTCALVRRARSVAGGIPKSWLGALVVSGLLFNSESKSILGRQGSGWGSAFCGLGWATALLMAAGLWLLPPSIDEPASAAG